MLKCPKCQSTEIAVRKNKAHCWNCECSFEIEETTPEKIKVFISYGHTEKEICEQICKAMEDRGYEVWFDAHNIEFDDDWRIKISEGIKSSNGVIACLSQYSVRNPGVCRNELRIAMNLKGGNIKSILLEDEREVQAPAEVTHNQWLDMHDWKEQKELGEENYQQWFEDKMSQLFRVLETKDNLQFAGQIGNIQNILKPIIANSKSQFLLQKDFFGRKWLTDEIVEWVENENEQICVIYGDPGIGKSAFISYLCVLYEKVMAYFFCEHNKKAYHSSTEIIKSLAYQLACKIPDYRWALDNILIQYQEKIGLLSDEELFETLLLEPSGTLMIDGNREAICIVVDGLDECGSADINPMAAFLAKYAERLPAWIKFIVSSRRLDVVKKYLSNASQIEIIGDDKRNIEDIRDYLRTAFKDEENVEELIGEICSKSQGIFLYAELIVKAYKKKKRFQPDEIPDGIQAVFYEWFSWIYTDVQKYKEFYREVIGLIILSDNPLPIYEISKIVEGWDENIVNDFVRIMEPFLTISCDYGNVKCISFAHKYMQDWIESETSGCYHVDVTPIGRKLVATLKEERHRKCLSLYEVEHLYEWILSYGSLEDKNEILMDVDVQNQFIIMANYFRDYGEYIRQRNCYYCLWEIATYSYKINMDVTYLNNAYQAATELVRNCESQRDYADALKFMENADAWFESVSMEEPLLLSGLYFQACKSIAKLVGRMSEAQNYCDLYVKIARTLFEKEENLQSKYEFAFAIYEQAHLAMETKCDYKKMLSLVEEGISILNGFLYGTVTVDTRDEKRDFALLLANYAEILYVLCAYTKVNKKEIVVLLYLSSLHMVKDDENDGWDKDKVTQIYYKYGTFLLAETKEIEAMKKAYKLAKQNWEKEASPTRKALYSVICRVLCTFYMGEGDFANAETYCDEEIALLGDDLSETGLIEERRATKYAYQNKAKILLYTGKIDQGIEYIKASMDIETALICQFHLVRDVEEFLDTAQRFVRILSQIPKEAVLLQIYSGDCLYEMGEVLADDELCLKGIYSKMNAANNYNRLSYYPCDSEDMYIWLIDKTHYLYTKNVAKYDEIHATAYMAYGEYLQKNKRLADAVENYRISLQLFAETAERNPRVAFYREKQVELKAKINDCAK